MDNRASSLFGWSGWKASSGLSEFALACCAVLILFCTVASAQTATGQFNGHVYDQSGAAVAGATVKVEDPATSWTRTVQSSGEGLYLLPLIPPGKYQITVTQAGFQAAVSQGLQLNVNQISTQDFHLQVGAPSQVVNVMRLKQSCSRRLRPSWAPLCNSARSVICRSTEEASPRFSPWRPAPTR